MGIIITPSFMQLVCKSTMFDPSACLRALDEEGAAVLRERPDVPAGVEAVCVAVDA